MDGAIGQSTGIIPFRPDDYQLPEEDNFVIDKSDSFVEMLLTS
jgi:hypothetical protein